MPMSEYVRRLRAAVGPMLLEAASVSVVIRDQDGRVLLARHSEGDVWVTPGGAIEPLETPADAAVRETWEETGLEVELVQLIGVFGGPEFVVTYGNGDRTSYLMVVFEARAELGGERPDGDEILELRWFSDDELRALPLTDWMREVLAGADGGDAFRPAAWRPNSG